MPSGFRNESHRKKETSSLESHPGMPKGGVEVQELLIVVPGTAIGDRMSLPGPVLESCKGLSK